MSPNGQATFRQIGGQHLNPTPGQLLGSSQIFGCKSQGTRSSYPPRVPAQCALPLGKAGLACPLPRLRQASHAQRSPCVTTRGCGAGRRCSSKCAGADNPGLHNPGKARAVKLAGCLLPPGKSGRSREGIKLSHSAGGTDRGRNLLIFNGYQCEPVWGICPQLIF